MKEETVKRGVGRPRVIKPAKAPKGAPKKVLADRKFSLKLTQTDISIPVQGALIQSKFGGSFAQFMTVVGQFISGLADDFNTSKNDTPCL